ncbi:MAG TPA: radical SAM protein [bacterium]|nr:radical SAM protein [bacterium]HOG38049.1 radical SAM protein [bacterium]
MKLSFYNKLGLFIKRHFFSLLPFLTFTKAINVIISFLEMTFRRGRCISRPFIYRIDPCSACNLRCPSCQSWQTNTKEKRIMTLEDFKSIIDKIKKYALRVSLYDMGEPLLNKDIYEMISYANKNNISTLISTNFNLFKKDDIKKLFDSGLTVLEPCLDGFSQEKYSQYRQGGDVEIVKQGLRDVMEYKIKNKKKYPIVDVQVVTFNHIKDELNQIDEFLREIKVDRITYRQENLGYDDNNDSPKTKTYKRTCFWLYLGCMIRPDGSLYPCCGGDFDRFSYGNILNQKLKDIWNNKYYKLSRNFFSKKLIHSNNKDLVDIPCSTCNTFVRK